MLDGGVQILPGEWAILAVVRPAPLKSTWSLCSDVCKKRLNRLRCRLGVHSWVQGSTYWRGSRSDKSIQRRDGWQDGDVAFHQNSLTTLFFKMTALSHYGFVKVRNCYCRYVPRINMRHLFKFYATWSNHWLWRWPFFRFWRFGFFLKFEIFSCQYGLAGQLASPCQMSGRSVKPFLRYGRFSIFQNGSRPPSWICFTRVWTTHDEYFGGLCHCAKFVWNHCSSFDNSQVLVFCALGLKMPIAPQNVFFVGIWPQHWVPY